MTLAACGERFPGQIGMALHHLLGVMTFGAGGRHRFFEQGGVLGEMGVVAFGAGPVFHWGMNHLFLEIVGFVAAEAGFGQGLFEQALLPGLMGVVALGAGPVFHW